ncbi:CocE/NonD family hydrolase [Microbaculum marinum]|uniref:CocE/NonD family hydrolase n=1 Tax=Microbaculum marinum TaxID=1764581 RepID=A0AAW9RL68_9HYPH
MPESYRVRDPIGRPEDKGARPPAYDSRIEDGVLIERDVAVTLRDGARIYVDVYRPADGPPVPPLIAWGPYGKHGHTRYSVNFPKADVDDSNMSAYTAFEAPDPFYWVPHGYAVINADPRGTWHSEGTATYLSPEEALDFRDLIEWAGTQAWSNGKVGLSGVSYLTSAQWRVAELNPPHLAAINPWEGWTDTYREVVRHGGIPETSFWPYLPTRWGNSTTRIEDLWTETVEHPFYDDFWASKAADFSKITVPAFVVASWTDQALHTRGTLEGFKGIASAHKWLYVHGRKKWKHYYDAASVEMQRAFFDHFLKGEETELAEWPRVRFEVRERYGAGEDRAGGEWPLAGTRYTPLWLDASAGRLRAEPVAAESTVGYASRADGGDPTRATFDHVFETPTDLVGHMKLRLWMVADAADDMDLFVAVQKLDRAGEVVPFAYYAQFEDGPVALGWLRASHRELDPERSTAFQPVLAHRRDLKLAPGEIVPLDIEIWPSGTRFDRGEGLRVVVQGFDIYDYPKPSVYARHEELVNSGRHTIHAGGRYDSHLLVPVVPR